MKLGLLIDLDTCVGCHACATACKEWNGASAISGPLADYDPYGAEPSGVWFNRVRHYEVGAHPDSKVLEELTKLIEAGKMKSIVSQTFPLAETSKAHEQVETRHTMGKVVLRVADEKK